MIVRKYLVFSCLFVLASYGFGREPVPAVQEIARPRLEAAAVGLRQPVTLRVTAMAELPPASRIEGEKTRQRLQVREQFTDKAEYVPLASPQAMEDVPPPPLPSCCTGPCPCVPQYVYGPHYAGGFLYYGTNASNDDWFNNYSGCCDDYSRCAPFSTALGRWWINLHNKHEE